MDKKNFFKEWSQQIIIGVSLLIITSVIGFSVTQLQKIDALERTIKELPTTDTQKLTKILEDIQTISGKSESRIKNIILSLKFKGVLTDAEILAILGSN